MRIELDDLPLHVNHELATKYIPLLKQLFHITHFNFRRFHFDYGMMLVGNGFEMVPQFWREFSELNLNYILRHISGNDFFIYGRNIANRDEQKMFDIREHVYHLPCGIALLKYHYNFVDLFHFASTYFQDDKLLNLFDQIIYLKKFTDFFIKEMQINLKNKANYVHFKNKKSILNWQKTVVSNYSRLLAHEDNGDEVVKKFINDEIMPRCNLRLTPAERECIYWVLRGKSASEIAIILGNASGTIEKHLYAIRKKFDCNKMSQVLFLADKYGFIKAGEIFEFGF